MRQFLLGLSLAAILFLSISCLYIGQPGLYYDEVLFADAALPGPAGSLEHQWHFGKWQIPVMLNPYLGALKAWLYAGIFHFFPPNPLTVRFPMILAGLGALLFATMTARHFWGNRSAILIAFLLSTDPSFIFTVRLDWGPVALMLLFKTAAIYFFLQYYKTSRESWLGLAGFCLGLGVFDKANFLWFVLSLPPAALLVWKMDFIRWITRRRALTLLAGFLLGAAPLIIYNIQRPGEMAKGQLGFTQPFLENLSYKAKLVRDSLDGQGAHFAVFGDKAVPPLTPLGELEPTRTLMSAALGVCLLLWLFLPRRKRWESSQPIQFFLWLTVFIFLQMLISAKATGSHHCLMLFPFQHLLLGGVSGCFLRENCVEGATRPNLLKVALLLFSVIFSLLFLSNLLLDVKFLRTIRKEGGRGVWSDAIYPLADYAKTNPARCFLHLDWGTMNPLLILGGRKICQQELFWRAESLPEKEAIQLLYQSTRQRGNLFLSIFPPFTKKSKARDRFKKMLSQHQMRSQLVRVFSQRDGHPLYRLEQVDEQERIKSDPASLFFLEAENWMEKRGGDLDLKGPASQEMALGMHWGSSIKDMASYWFSLDRDIQDLELHVRFAFNDTNPHFFLFSLDGTPRRIYSFESTGGFGYIEQQWRIDTFKLGSVAQGSHTLTIQPAGNNQMINLDWLEFREGGTKK